MPLTLLASSRGRAENTVRSDGADLPGVMFVLRHIFGLGFFFPHAHGKSLRFLV